MGLLWPVLVLLWLWAMISSESLWIDEGATALFAQQPDFAHAWSTLMAAPGSEAQMPLGMFMHWLWAKVWGVSEWGLRAPNMVYGLLAFWALWRLGRLARVTALPWLVVASPFFTFQLNEARPYTLVFAAAAWSLYGLVRWLQSAGTDAQSLPIFVGSSLVLLATHMLGLFWVGPACLLLVWMAVRRRWHRS